MNVLINTYKQNYLEQKWRKTCFVTEVSEKKRAACLMGWVHDYTIRNETAEKQILSLIMRDSSGVKEFLTNDPQLISSFKELERESVIALKTKGTTILEIKLLSPSKKVPLSPCSILNHSDINLVIQRPYAIRTERMKMILKIQDQIFASGRKFFQKEKFYELRPPIIGPATDPGVRGAKTGEIDFYGEKYKLTTSMILYKQMAICSLEKVYSFSPNVRLEDPSTIITGRHLAEFCQLDIEEAFANYYDMMELGEKLIVAILKNVNEKCQKELTFLGAEITIPKRPFCRISYQKAIEHLAEMNGYKIDEGQEIPWEAERALSMEYDSPFWIIQYPTGSRGFYDRINPERPNYLNDFDLMYPQGFGEAISGSEREFLHEIVQKKMIQQGLILSDYNWYLEMLQRGIPPSAGFGLGIERLTRYICRLEKIWEATAFPKVPGVHSP